MGGGMNPMFGSGRPAQRRGRGNGFKLPALLTKRLDPIPGFPMRSRAYGIHKPAAGANGIGGAKEQPVLGVGTGLDVGGLGAPSCIRITRPRSDPGARRVQ